MQQEIFKSLEEFGIKLSQVEDAIGCPQNYLSRFKKPENVLPKKWIQPLLDFLDKYRKDNGLNGQPDTEAVKKIQTPVMAVNAKRKLDLTPSKEKLIALQEAVDGINKDYGEGSVMRLGDAPIKGVEIISTGSLTLNKALGVGGFPKGRIVEIFGKASSGKTTVAIHSIVEAQKRGGRCAFIDLEHAFDPTYAKNIGVDIDNLYLSQPNYAEQALEEADRLMMSGAYSVIVFDSVAAMVPKAELEGSAGDLKIGLNARLMSQACRKLTGAIYKTDTLFIFINQVRDKIGAMPYEEQTYQPGGHALKFFSSVRLQVSRKATLKDGEEMIGIKVSAKVAKNKVAPPFKICEYDIMFGTGIDTLGEIVDLASEKGIITKSGSWYSYNGAKIGQGRESVKQLLLDNPETLKEVEDKLSQP